MPLPQEETLPQDAPAASSSSSSSAPGVPPAKDLSSVMDKFRQLGEELEAEEAEDQGDNADGDSGDEGNDIPEGGEGQGGEGGKKKKKKKKKSKASKAVDRLRTIASGQAPQSLVDTVRQNLDSSEQGATDEEIRKAMAALKVMKMLDGQVAVGNKSNTKTIGEHKFWKTQPVPQSGSATAGPSRSPDNGHAHAHDHDHDHGHGECSHSHSHSHSHAHSHSHSHSPAHAHTHDADIGANDGPIDAPKTPADVRQEPGGLPGGFEWSLIDIKNHEQCVEVYTLLSENYVEDDDAMFRFRYSKEFLLWALTAPGYFPDWHIGVRVQKTGKLVAFISGIKVDIRVRTSSFPSAEINFLCVHKKLRSKRLTPVLIKEVTRRVNLENIWQAIYTAGIVIPTPFSTCRYYHRNLNPPKLVDIGFSPLAKGQTITRLVRALALPAQTTLPGFREMEIGDVREVGELLRRYLARFDIEQEFKTDREVEHWFLSGKGKGKGKGGSEVDEEVDEDGGKAGRVVWAYVVEDPETRRITDLISFYSLPSSIMKHAKHKVLNAAYMFYYASDVVFQPQTGGSADAADNAAWEEKNRQRLGKRLNRLVEDMMVVAKNAGFDVFNALTLMDNNLFLSDQKFGAGDGFLNYYLYNWQCAPIDGGTSGTGLKRGAGIGVVML